MLRDFFGAFKIVSDFFVSAIGIGILDLGVFGVLKLGADCFLVFAGSFKGSVIADFIRKGFGVEARRTSLIGDILPDDVGETVPNVSLLATEDLLKDRCLIGSTGEILPVEVAGEILGGVLEGLSGLVGVGKATGRSAERRPCVTRRTWHGSWRERKCSSVSQPPPTRTIM